MDADIRKILKLHLAKWSSTMVQIVGLERVAEELMGRTKWGIKPDMSMMVGQDWRPSSDTAPSPSPLTPPASCNNSATTASVGSGGGAGGSFWEGDCSSSGSSSPGAVPAWFLRPPESPPDQPLDLSAKSRLDRARLLEPPRVDRSSPGPSNLPTPTIKLPALPRNIIKAKPRLSAVPGRRTYTEEELQAALRDIQSGKLGTRRAAVIYGIPRSTLRNKVYKLSQERRDKEEEVEEDEEEDEEEKEVLGVLRKPIFTVEDVVRLAGNNVLPHLDRMVRDRDGMPEAVRNMIAEERRLDEIRIPSLKGSPPTSPSLRHGLNNNEEKKASSSKSAAAAAAAAAAAGGKGTRPKRGKYRNYDRDSLVEAVRAVQRGEMSVHRAGSYYGVPHSTLEYKVKERHLMRPRKREPKLQNALQEEIKRKEEADKRTAAAQLAVRRPPRFPPPPTNGLKIGGLLDPALYPGWPVWPPHWPAALESAYSRPEFFSPVNLLRLSEEQASTSAAAAAAAGLTNAARRVAEQLYDGSGENGSFLDGIIRSSLEEPLSDLSKPPATPQLDQLVKDPTPSRSPSPQPQTSSACDNNQST